MRQRITFLTFILLIGVLMPACGSIVPATTPPQLEWTAGPPMVVTDRVFESADFTVNYPQGWRVITGQAHLPTNVIFVSPDERSTLTFIMGGLPEGNLGSEGMMTDIRQVNLEDGTQITVIGKSPAESFDEFQPILEAVVASVR